MRVQLEGSAGGRIETEGFWICMNKDTLTPSRLADDCIERFGTTTDNHRLKWHPWLTEPVRDGTEIPFPLRRTDIDHFEHVNNSIYWHGVIEILGQLPDPLQAPYRAVLEYRSPIKFGEALTIHSDHHRDAVRMHFAVGDQVRAAALVRKI
jgi:acyl-ACP thioesterase